MELAAMQNTQIPNNNPETTPQNATTSKEKKRKKLKIALISLAGLILVSAIIVFTYYNHKLNLINFDDGSDTSVNLNANLGNTYDDINDAASKLEEYKDKITVSNGNIIKSKDVINILLLGTDERTEEYNENARADSIILLSMNTQNKTIKLISFERGMAVPIAGTGEDDWLTHTFRYGGANLTVKTIEDSFKLNIDHYLRINFYSFKPIVDAVGGIDIELTEAEANALKLKPGMNHLTGEKAIIYSRLRKIDSDWYRVQRQRNVIKACISKIDSLSVLELNSLIDKVLPMVITDMTKSDISSMTATAIKFLGTGVTNRTEGITIPAKGTYGSKIGMGGRSMFACDFNKNKAIIDEFLYG